METIIRKLTPDDIAHMTPEELAQLPPEILEALKGEKTTMNGLNSLDFHIQNTMAKAKLSEVQ
jgi:hypothetical protein